MSIITEEVLLDETGDDLNERQANKVGFAHPILIEDLGHYDTKNILSSLTNIRVEVPLIFCHSFDILTIIRYIITLRNNSIFFLSKGK